MSQADADLVAAVAAGDRQAFAELYARHAPWLVARLGRRCADNGLVDEAVQDTFVAVWRGAGKWSGRGDVAAWIWGIGVRRLIDGVRRPRPIATAMAELVGPMARRQTVASAEEQVLLGTQYGDVGAALDRLSPDLRSVVQATVLDAGPPHSVPERHSARALEQLRVVAARRPQASADQMRCPDKRTARTRWSPGRSGSSVRAQ